MKDARAKAEEAEADSLGEVLDFMRLIWAVHHALQKTSKRMERSLGVTGPQRLVLRVLARRPNASAGELARTLHTDPSTLTGVLRRLEEAKFIQRIPHDRDARKIQLSITKAGRAYAKDNAQTVEAAVKRALKKISPDSVRHTKKVLSALADELAGEQLY